MGQSLNIVTKVHNGCGWYKNVASEEQIASTWGTKTYTKWNKITPCSWGKKIALTKQITSTSGTNKLVTMEKSQVHKEVS